jgi:hypothetical protein
MFGKTQQNTPTIHGLVDFAMSDWPFPGLDKVRQNAQPTHGLGWVFFGLTLPNP